MSVIVRALADGDVDKFYSSKFRSGFLIIFCPPIAPSDVPDPASFPGSYSIIVDPCLKSISASNQPLQGIDNITEPDPYAAATGQNPSDSASSLGTPVSSIADLPEPDMIIITSNLPDRCDEETLCQLSPHVQCPILASRRAARKIKSWRHFDQIRVETFVPYSIKSAASDSHHYRDEDSDDEEEEFDGEPEYSEGIYRVTIPSFCRIGGKSGYVTLSLLPGSRTLDPVVVGMTYQPPSSVLSSTPLRPQTDYPGSQPGLGVRMISSAGGYQRPSTAASHSHIPFSSPLATSFGPLMSSRIPYGAQQRPTTQSASPSIAPSSSRMAPTAQQRPPTQSESLPTSEVPSFSPVLRAATLASERPVSVMYAPDGLSSSQYKSLQCSSYSLDSPLIHYISNHLIRNASLPLTCLIHPFEPQSTTRSWWGRKVPVIASAWKRWRKTPSSLSVDMTQATNSQSGDSTTIGRDSTDPVIGGARGGALLAKALRARTWIGAPPTMSATLPVTSTTLNTPTIPSTPTPLFATSSLRFLGRRNRDISQSTPVSPTPLYTSSAPTPILAPAKWTVERVQTLLEPTSPTPALGSSIINDPIDSPRPGTVAHRPYTSHHSSPHNTSIKPTVLSSSVVKTPIPSPSTSPTPSGSTTYRTSTGSDVSTAATSISAIPSDSKSKSSPAARDCTSSMGNSSKSNGAHPPSSSSGATILKVTRPATGISTLTPVPLNSSLAILQRGMQGPKRVVPTTKVVMLQAGEMMRAEVFA